MCCTYLFISIITKSFCFYTRHTVPRYLILFKNKCWNAGIIPTAKFEKGGQTLDRGEYKKERSDKKRQVKPLIPIDTKEAIHRLSHITSTPIKDVCEFLICHVIRDKKTIDVLATYFRRSVMIDQTFCNGNINVKHIGKRLNEPGELVSITFKKLDYELISALAYALDCTPTRTTSILLQHATCDIRAVNEYVYINMRHQLTEGQIKELRKVLTYINHYNDDAVSWAAILSKIVGDVRPATKKLYELVEEFLKRK